MTAAGGRRESAALATLRIRLSAFLLPAPAADPRARDPWWDNARFTAAALIVVLHVVGSLLARHEELRAFSVATWPLRVPAFVILAGVFSKAGPLNPRDLRGLLQFIALPAAVFSLLYSLERWALGAPFTLHVAQLPWTLWFLMSLFCWRLLIPLVVQLRYPLLVTLSAALAVGYFEEFGLQYSASRTVVYLPLFYLGWRLGRGDWRELFDRRWTAWAAAAVLAASLVGGTLWQDRVKGTWTSMRHAYDTGPFGLGIEWAWTVRLGMLVWAVLMFCALLRLLPRRRVPFVSYLGAGGFTIYLLHPLVILPLREHGLISRLDSPPLLVAAGLVLTLLLGSPPVRRLAAPLVRPRADWFLARRPAPAQAPPPRAAPAHPATPGAPAEGRNERGHPAAATGARVSAGAAGAGSAGRSSWSGSSTDAAG